MRKIVLFTASSFNLGAIALNSLSFVHSLLIHHWFFAAVYVLVILASLASLIFLWRSTRPGVLTANAFVPSDPDFPSTFGWRCWRWDPTAKLLASPQQADLWHTPELRCDSWDTNSVVRGYAGIHAHLVPKNWTRQVVPEAIFASAGTGRGFMFNSGGGNGGPSSIVTLGQSSSITYSIGGGGGGYADTQSSLTQICPFVPPPAIYISGIVERYGKYVLGKEGWRAEIVHIRKLLAPNTEIGLALERAYPDIEVIYSQPADAPAAPTTENSLGHR